MSRTAAEAGWRVSAYNIAARLPGTDRIAVVNLFQGTCGAYTPIEMFLLDEMETLDEKHPILKRFRDRGLIVNFDERAALEALARMACGVGKVQLTICPTMGCNFDCPYCFENHRMGQMSQEIQDDVVSLAARMLKASGGKALHVTWYGGEPLLTPDIVETLSVRLMALARESGATYSAYIITNGYLLTQDIADMLRRCGVRGAQITMDGIGQIHDETRHLAGGYPTFDRIVENLRCLRLPFRVDIRHNVHASNRNQVAPLQKLAEELSAQSGNDITCHIATVHDSSAAEDRSTHVRLLCGEEADKLELSREVAGFHAGRGIYCGAHRLFMAGIDDRGQLFKCWEDVDKPERSFGTAHRWDPADPIATADEPDQLTRYLNTALPTDDPECRECVFLPQCAGGCPTRRLYYGKDCISYRDVPERYVLALYERISKEKKGEIP